MPDIIPAILTDNQSVFTAQLEQINTFGCEFVQVDFTDNKFVPSKTLLPDELDAFVLSKSSVSYEAHLMTVEPEQYFSTLYTLGFTRVAIHYQTLADPTNTIALAKDFGFELGIAINPDIPADVLNSYLGDIDYILFMTVVPGEQGHPFEKKVLEKIKSFLILKETYPHIAIETDGAANKDTIPLLTAAGAERIAVGSAIWKADDAQTSYDELVRLIQG